MNVIGMAAPGVKLALLRHGRGGGASSARHGPLSTPLPRPRVKRNETRDAARRAQPLPSAKVRGREVARMGGNAAREASLAQSIRAKSIIGGVFVIGIDDVGVGPRRWVVPAAAIEDLHFWRAGCVQRLPALPV